MVLIHIKPYHLEAVNLSCDLLILGRVKLSLILFTALDKFCIICSFS
ncbi:hypothetical protein CoNPh17_CDS0112 [Staphylococcus phage S-CoN_Ph17]|nr:hypothetical protein CoNPh17_CDS0112 [Staphylococcus phage S-CoN_Ph17]